MQLLALFPRWRLPNWHCGPLRSTPSRWGFLKIVKRLLPPALSGRSELQIIQFSNDSEAWWYAFNPKTGQQIYAATEEELHRWISAEHQGGG
jgi:hypothetical protein